MLIDLELGEVREACRFAENMGTDYENAECALDKIEKNFRDLVSSVEHLLSVISTDEHPSEADLWPVRDALTKSVGNALGARCQHPEIYDRGECCGVDPCKA